MTPIFTSIWPWCMWAWSWTCTVCSAALLLLFIVLVLELLASCVRPLAPIAGRTCIVVGGSSGIGLSVAHELVNLRAKHVILVARTVSKLNAAKMELLEAVSEKDGIELTTFSADVTDATATRRVFETILANHGSPDVLVLAAGASTPQYFVDTSIEQFKEAMQLNYMGIVHSLKAVLPAMIQQSQQGHRCHVLLVGSAMSVCGWLGYSAYAPSKWAVRGLADCLRNELCGFDIDICIAYPPDTNTPGFELENQTKPMELRMLFPPTQAFESRAVASDMVLAMRKRLYHAFGPDLLVNYLTAFMAGVTPRNSFALDTLMHPLMMVVATVFRMYADRVTRQYAVNIKKNS